LLQPPSEFKFEAQTSLLINSNNNELVIYVEKLWGRPGNSIHSTWGMAEEYGRIKGILESMGLEYVLVAPMIWQKMYKRNYGLKSSKIYSERKENLFNVCKKIFPEHKMFKYAADSILICENIFLVSYCDNNPSNGKPFSCSSLIFSLLAADG